MIFKSGPDGSGGQAVGPGAVFLGGLDQKRAVPGADQEFEVVERIVIHRAVSYLLSPAGAISLRSE